MSLQLAKRDRVYGREPGGSCNRSRLRKTGSGRECTYRIGLCGFKLSGNPSGLADSLREAAQLAFHDFPGRKLLLMPGRWQTNDKRQSTSSWPTLNPIARITKGGFYTAVSASGKRLPLKIYQEFATSKEAEPALVNRLVDECRLEGKRAIDMDGITVGLLICGENNVLVNEQRNHNRAHVRFRPKTFDLFRGVPVIFNGAHTTMGEWGKLQRRFEFLSKGKRWAFYATNSNKKTWGRSTLQAYYDGRRIATSNGSQSQLKRISTNLVRSRNDRCIILALDIRVQRLLHKRGDYHSD